MNRGGAGGQTQTSVSTRGVSPWGDPALGDVTLSVEWWPLLSDKHMNTENHNPRASLPSLGPA